MNKAETISDLADNVNGKLNRIENMFIDVLSNQIWV